MNSEGVRRAGKGTQSHPEQSNSNKCLDTESVAQDDSSDIVPRDFIHGLSCKLYVLKKSWLFVLSLFMSSNGVQASGTLSFLTSALCEVQELCQMQGRYNWKATGEQNYVKHMLQATAQS